ncbi:MAG TPA: metallophosphoesterase [Gaiellaceae bacterium]|jgi:Icc-related predicted phosphoesterase|nr:metallophosphoesterase [Gaiellaceae bacterium]
MGKTIRVAAAGDIHASAADGDRVIEAFRRVEEQADLVLLAGDLTQHGQVDEVCVVADACRDLEVPVVAVLGNHDWHSDRPADLVRALAEAGVVVLDRSHTILPVKGVSVGVAGVKGFVGGFGNQWANFGEPIFREAYAETTRDVDGLERGLAAIEPCAVRIALLHYSPAEATLAGEPERLWLVLGADRLAGPIRQHRPDLVVHGHAHHGSFEGEVDGVPVYNVAVHVMGREFWVFELDAEQRAPTAPLAVEET